MNPETTDIASILSGFDPAASAATLPTIVGVGLACGLLLWLLGSKVLRPAAAVLGGAIGSAAGILAPTTLGIMEIAGVPASLVGLGVGAVLGMLFALALYRAVLTFSTGLVFGAAGLMTSLAIYSPGVVPSVGPDAGPNVQDPVTMVDTALYVEAAAIVIQDDGSADGGPPATIERVVSDRALAFVGATADAVGGYWNAMPERSRLMVLASTVGSLMFGLLLGLVAPERASAVVTASLGSGLWLYCFAWLSAAENAPWTGSLDLGARGWAIAWAVTAAVGFAAQLLLWSGKKKPARESGEKDT
jgi:hypothetical protein